VIRDCHDAHKSRITKSEIPLDRIADSNLPTLDDFGERAAAPALAHRLLESGQRLVHALARARLTMNEQARRPDAKRFAARVEEIDRIDDQVRTPRVRLEVAIPAIRQLVPPLAIDQRDLPLSALVRISGYPAACDERRTLGRVHFSAMCALNPDLVKHSHVC
jgi:hypothetical protein